MATTDPVTWHRVTATRIWNRQAYLVAARHRHVGLQFRSGLLHDTVQVFCDDRYVAGSAQLETLSARFGRSSDRVAVRLHTTSVRPRPYRRP